MRNLDVIALIDVWLNRPICRRYAVVVFSALPRPSEKSHASEDRTICWAYGCLTTGESEILGAWNLDETAATTAEVFGDLQRRGVEFIRCCVGDLCDAGTAFVGDLKMTELFPSIEQTLASLIGAVKPRHREQMENLLRREIGEAGRSTATVPLTTNSSEDLRQKYPEIVDRWSRAVARSQPLLALPEPYRHLVRSADRAAATMQERLMRSIHHRGAFTDSAEAFSFVVDWLARADLRLQREADAERVARDELRWASGCLARAGRVQGTPALA